MPKNITATEVQVEGLGVQADDQGAIIGLTAMVNVGYGETRVREEFDLWAELTESQRTAFQGLYSKLTQQLQATYLA